MIDSAMSEQFPNNQTLIPKWPKWGVFGSIVATLILTILMFPAPIGFETRPQDNVSYFWLGLFLTILVAQIATLVLIFKRPRLGVISGLIAGVLEILQVIADQAHRITAGSQSYLLRALRRGCLTRTAISAPLIINVDQVIVIAATSKIYSR